ncbi:hypothetical protein ABKN59_006773 [Abortiporus biennis]
MLAKSFRLLLVDLTAGNIDAKNSFSTSSIVRIPRCHHPQTNAVSTFLDFEATSVYTVQNISISFSTETHRDKHISALYIRYTSIQVTSSHRSKVATHWPPGVIYMK